MGIRLNPQGYPVLGDKMIHVRIAERAFGGPLPKGAQVHHWNEDKTDNTHTNLCICPNQKYHLMLHIRAAAFDACGNANYRKCEYCKQYDAPENLMAHRSRHHACHAAANLRRYYAKKETEQ